jgi:hypothetical protein
MDQLLLRPARGACRTLAGVLDLEVDASLARVELDLGDVPGWLQAKRGGPRLLMSLENTLKNGGLSLLNGRVLSAQNILLKRCRK